MLRTGIGKLADADESMRSRQLGRTLRARVRW